MTAKRKYGWRPDLPDHRDHMYCSVFNPLALPEEVDLRPCMPPVYNQRNLGSCTGNALGGAFQYDQLKVDSAKSWMPSRLFIYFNERELEGTVNEDAGAMIRDGIKTMAAKGVCPEAEWPYVETQFAVKPPAPCYEHALAHQIVSYKRVPQTLYQLQACLAEGYPVTFGFTVYDSFETPEVAHTGVAPMPGPDDTPAGGHAVLMVGYSNSRKAFLVRNSWGEEWGDKGYFWLPYAYVCNPRLAQDFWVIKSVEMD